MHLKHLVQWTVTIVYNHIIITQTISLTGESSLTPLLNFPPLEVTTLLILITLWLVLPIPETSYNGIMWIILLCLESFAQHNVFEIHPCRLSAACPFYCWVVSHYMKTQKTYLSVLLLMDVWVNILPLMDILVWDYCNKAAMNHLV